MNERFSNDAELRQRLEDELLRRNLGYGEKLYVRRISVRAPGGKYVKMSCRICGASICGIMGKQGGGLVITKVQSNHVHGPTQLNRLEEKYERRVAKTK